MRMILKKPFMVLLSILLAFNTSVTAVLALDSELPENPQDETAISVETETEEKEGNQDEQITVETEETQMVEEKEAEETASVEDTGESAITETVEKEQEDVTEQAEEQPVTEQTETVEEGEVTDPAAETSEEETVAEEVMEETSEQETEEAGTVTEDGETSELTEEGEEALDAVEEITDEQQEEVVEVIYPAFSISKTVNGITVTVYAPEGSLPEGTDIRVVPVTAQEIFAAVESEMEQQGLVLTDIVAFDITPVDAEGTEVQPLIPVTVGFFGTSLSTLKGDSVNVYCVADDASSVSEVNVDTANANQQIFTAEHFTIYAASSGGSSSDPNGDGSGANNADNPYVLPYGDTVRLGSNQSGVFINLWQITDGEQYANLDGRTVINQNTSNEAQTVVVTHTYGLRTERYYIKAMPEEFTVTFMLQDVGEDEFTVIHESRVYKGHGVEDIPQLDSVKTVDEKTYYLYSWYSEEGCQNFADLEAVTGDMTVYARYTMPQTIHYVKNTSDAATVPEDWKDGIGNTVTIEGASRSGYSLAYWNTAPDGSGTTYHEGESITMPDDGLTLYAFWTKENLVMRYHYNYGGSGTDQFRSVTNISKNSRTALLTEIPSRPNNYIFLGWSLTPSGNPEYYPGATFTTGDKDVDLYAKWGQLTELDLKTLTAKGTTVTYDGQPHAIAGVEEEESDQFPGYVYVGEKGLFEYYAKVTDIRAEGTNVGSYATPIYAELFNRIPVLNILASADEYVEVTNNVLRINPVEVTLETLSDEKDYDGKPLTAGGKLTFGEETVEFTHDASVVTLVNGEVLNIRTIGSQTDPGESENEFELDWGKPEWGTATTTATKYNYKFTETVIGTLKVKEIEYSLVSGDGNSWTKESGNTSDFVFESTHKDATAFDNYVVKVDGKELEADDFTAEVNADKQLEIKLTQEFLETLDGGEHTLIATFTDKFENDKPVAAKFTVIIPDVDYSLKTGDGNTWTKGSNKTSDFVFECSDEKESFETYIVKVDDKEVDSAEFTAEVNKEGELELRLSPEFLETLAGGSHKVTAVFTDRFGREKEVSGSFMVNIPTNPDNPNPSDPTDPTVDPTDSTDPTADPEEAVVPEPQPSKPDKHDPDPDSTVPDSPAPQPEADGQWALVNLLSAAGSAVTTVVSMVTAKNNARFFGLIPTIGSAILFALTENLTGKMVAVDKYTIPFILLLAACVAVAYVAKNKKDGE